MSPLVLSILALIQAAPGAIAQIQALWNLARPAASASDQKTIDAILGALNPKVDADLGDLNAAAGAAAVA